VYLVFPSETGVLSPGRPARAKLPCLGTERLLDELLTVARRLGIEVRVEPFRGGVRSPGGLCRLRGRVLVLIDQRLGVFDRTRTLAEALSELDVEGVYLTPEARRIIEAARGRPRV
jgi:hypothetical protein